MSLFSQNDRRASLTGVIGKIIALEDNRLTLSAPDLLVRCTFNDPQTRQLRQGQFVLVVGNAHYDPGSGRLTEINPVMKLEILDRSFK